MNHRTPQAHTLAAAAAIAGIFQLVATLELSLASDRAVLRAAHEGPLVYAVAAASIAAFAGLVVWQRHRPWLVCVALALPGLATAALVVALLGSWIGLAYHGELLLHHFLAALCAAACVTVPLSWARDPTLGRLRALPAVPAVLGAVLLVVEHLQRAPAGPVSLMGQVGTASLLLAPLLALVCLWPRLQPPRLRAAATLALLPLGVRLALGGPLALQGMTLGTDAALPVLAALGVAAFGGFALVRPRADRGLHGAALTLAAIVCYSLHRAYTMRFGELEVVLGGLASSLFGFALPYPGYLPAWRLVAAMLVLFVLFALTFAAVLSRRDHVRGLCLMVLVVAGLGLTSPQLVLMVGAGSLLALDTLAGAPPPPSRSAPPPRPLEAIVADAAALLGLPDPIVLEQQSGTVVALRGELDHNAIELRARHEREGWAVTLVAGVLGRGAPELELLPDAAVAEPNPIVPGHRLKGDARRLENLPEELLAALTAFPGHRTRLWSGGCQVELGPHLERLDAPALASVLRGMSRST